MVSEKCRYRVLTSVILIRILIRILIPILILVRVTLHLRIANQMGEDSRCREGIVHSRGGCSRARSVWRQSPKALWRFRVSTSNSPSGRTRPHTNTHTSSY